MVRQDSTAGVAQSAPHDVLKPQFTKEEWLALAPPPVSDEGMTINEICVEMGKNRPWVQNNIITPGLADGTIVAGKAKRLSATGRPVTWNVYRIVKK